MPAFNLKRSGGYEGMALSRDGSKLYGLLEGPLYMADGQVEKTEDGATALRIIELDTAKKEWTGRTPGFIRWRRVAKPSATSTCLMTAPHS